MIRRRVSAPPASENLDRWLLTYADLITLLTIFFLLLYSMSVVSRGKFSSLASSVRGSLTPPKVSVTSNGAGVLPGSPQSENSEQKYVQSMQNLNQYVEQHRLKDKVSVAQETRGIVISMLADNMLFERGKAEVQGGASPLMAKVSRLLQTVKNTVQVEGHTCDLKINTPQFPSNWELSTSRAGAIVREFTERYSLDAKRFRAAGYASIRPVVPNISEGNRARNRRVDIVIMKTEGQREAEVIRKTELSRVLISPPPSL
ncbi:MAG: OmpA family protein [Armatimonadetes bacterium]|nr:OmpA family protein [Armatimonadota bacterium]